MQTMFLMRYSYFGQSDWRSAASKDASKLLSDIRLEKRFALFEKLPLASLRDQTDQDFELVVLGSEAMAAKHKKFLTEATMDVLGSERAHILFRPPSRASNEFRKYLKTIAKSDHTISTLLDDDDAVSTDFTETVRREAKVAVEHYADGQDHCFLSFSRGLNLIFHPDGGFEFQLRNVITPAQGLALISHSGSRRSLFNIAHRKLFDRRPVRIIAGPNPMYIRSVHDTNDSRGRAVSPTLERKQVEKLAETRFPLLKCFVSEKMHEEKSTVSVAEPLE